MVHWKGKREQNHIALRNICKSKCYSGKSPRIQLLQNRGVNRRVCDVRVVLDYLADRESLLRRNQKLRNPEEVMRMLHALTGDVRYLENISYMEERGGRNMCDLLDAAENRGLKKGLQKGLQKGRQEGLQMLITVCKELGASFEETAAKLKEKYSLGDKDVEKNMKLYW